MDTNIGKKLDGRYELLELIGVGGMADIYRAKDLTEDKTVAVKILKNEFSASEDFIRRFRNESKAIALLSHPNIVKIYDVGLTEKIQFIVMEYIDGITLTDYIERQGVLKWRDAVHFTTQILRALQHAHDRGIVHRDIKSSNVMLLSDGTIKVMDFGIARFNRETDKTISEKAIGSVHYISPEQARGDVTDEKSDIYSVGVMLYEMLSGKKPFDGDNPVSIALMHMQSQAKKLSELNPTIPEGLEEIVTKAMQKEPSKRYQTAGEMINDIEEFKKNPSIVFEYKYFSTDGTTKYFDKVSEPENEKSKSKKRVETPDDEDSDEDDYDDEYDDDDDVEERRSPLLPILFAVASVFVIMTAWLIYTMVAGMFNQGTLIDNGSSNNDTTIIMENLIGKTWDQVQEEYPDMNFEPVLENSSDYPKYTVMKQSVATGRTIKKTQQVTLTISNGPKMVEIDNYTNYQVDQVMTLLENQGLHGVARQVEDEDIPEGYVIKTDPEARTQVEAGSTVYVYVSWGAAETMTNVPQMVGMKQSWAEDRAKEYGIILTIIEVPSTEEKGYVLSQSIEALTKVDRNTVVEIEVSNGEIPTNSTTIPISITNATGTFVFEYYIDGVLQSAMTETRDVAESKRIDWTVSGTELKTYVIKVTSTATGKSDTFLKMEVDFTQETPKKTTITFNSSIFSQLSVVDTTPPSVTGSPDTSPEVTTDPFATNPPVTTPPTSLNTTASLSVDLGL